MQLEVLYVCIQTRPKLLRETERQSVQHVDASRGTGSWLCLENICSHLKSLLIQSIYHLNKSNDLIKIKKYWCAWPVSQCTWVYACAYLYKFLCMYVPWMKQLCLFISAPYDKYVWEVWVYLLTSLTGKCYARRENINTKIHEYIMIIK